MTRIGRRLIEDFLLPALNDEKYGDLLKWIDRDKRYFSIRWSHKNAAKWTLADTAVFQDWDRLKGHYHPEIKGYYMQAKQRFRAALYKLSTVRKVPCEDKHVKKYQLILDPDKKNHEIMPRKLHPRMPKEENQRSIPTPVICRNTSFIAKPQTHYEGSNSSPSSPGSIKSEGCDRVEDEMEMCVEEYQRALRNQRKQSTNSLSKTVKTEVPDCPSTVLRESPEVNIRKAHHHVPIQPVPVYNNSRCGFLLSLENYRKNQPVIEVYEKHDNSTRNLALDNNPHKRVESPRLLLVPTYADEALENTVITMLSYGYSNNLLGNFRNIPAPPSLPPGIKSEDSSPPVRKNEDSSPLPPVRKNVDSSPVRNSEDSNASGALNLTVKNENSAVPCR